MSDECCGTVSHSKILFKDKKGGPSEAILLNTNRREIVRCDIDGCLVNDGKKCDFIAQEIGKWTILIELKGSDVKHAVKQFDETLTSNAVKERISGSVALLVVCTKVRVPNVSAYLLKCKQRYAREFGVKFHAKSGGGEFCPYQLSGCRT